MKLYLSILLTVFSQIALAQSGWNWPEDSLIARKKISLLPEMIESSDYSQAEGHYLWLTENAPDLHVSLYIHGAKLYNALIEQTDDNVEKKRYGRLLMSAYDDRLKYFGDKPVVFLRKAYTGYKLFADEIDQLKPLIATTDSALHYFDGKSADGLYLIGASLLYKAAKNDVITDNDELLRRFDHLLTGFALEEHTKETTQATLYNLLKKSVKFDCAQLERWLMPGMLENPEDTVLARRIMSLSFSTECTDEEFFVKTVDMLVQYAPTVTLLKYLAGKKEKNGENDAAEKYYLRAINLAVSEEEKAEINFRLARLYQRAGNYALSHRYAIKNTEYGNASQAAWELIGDLWYASFAKCKGGKSIVQDRGVYLAAYKAYQKAGNQEKMNLAAQHFPSIEEIFDELMKEGEEITVECWATERVVLRRRKDVTQ